MDPARRTHPGIKAATLAVLLLHAPTGLAHGPDHAFIQAVTEELVRRPGDPDLLLQRGERLRSHGDLAAARSDLAAALAGRPGFVPAQLRLALVAREEGKLEEALSLLDRALATESTNLLARTARADVLARAGRHAAAAGDLDLVLASPAPPRPDLYLARARAQLAADPAGITNALAGIEEGIRRLGDVPSLQLFALDLEERGGHHDQALRRIDTLAAGSTRKERWLMRRGDVLLKAGRTAQAREAYQAALHALDTLPERLRRTIASEELRRDLMDRLAVPPEIDGNSKP